MSETPNSKEGETWDVFEPPVQPSRPRPASPSNPAPGPRADRLRREREETNPPPPQPPRQPRPPSRPRLPSAPRQSTHPAAQSLLRRHPFSFGEWVSCCIGCSFFALIPDIWVSVWIRAIVISGTAGFSFKFYVILSGILGVVGGTIWSLYDL